MKNNNFWFILFIIAIIAVNIYPHTYKYLKRRKINKKIELLAANVAELTPEEFFKLRNFSFGGRGRPQYSSQKNFKGVYIIFNQSKNLYYVGQSKRILDRVNSHFTGKGNGDVYADYKYGDKFTIKMISLKNSGYKSLNTLEKDTISKYNSFANGYNKTRGNNS